MSIPFVDLSAMHSEIRSDLDRAWNQALDSNGFIGGTVVDRFEESWARYCETRHCVGVGNGTVALELALKALGIGRGDEVLVPANTFIATASAVAAVGARPVFIDVDPATLLVTAEGIRNAISSRTAAVIVVHLFGQPADMDGINAVASNAGLLVIEDAAQAHGATWDGRRAGSMSAAGCFSFYPGKNLGAFGDAGAVVTNDVVLADKIRVLANHGRNTDEPYRHDALGTNARLDALQAAVLLAKLPYLDSWNQARHRVAQAYATALTGLPVQWVSRHAYAKTSWHLAVVQTPHRTELRRALQEHQIATGIHYPIPCHLQAPFAGERVPPLPNVESAAKRILSLPMYPHLSEPQIAQIAEVIRRTLHGRLGTDVLASQEAI